MNLIKFSQVTNHLSPIICNRARIIRILLLILAFLLSGCKSDQWKLNNYDLLNWKYGDLRLLDPTDAAEPDQDLIAIYTRIIDQSFQVRIDFLDLETESEHDIYMPIDTNLGGLTQIKINTNDPIPVEISWDYMIKIPTSGNVVILNDHLSPVYGMSLLIVRDTAQDSIVISFNKSVLPISLSKTKLQVVITPINQNDVADKSDPVSIDAPSPARAKVLFTFWNTFSSTTPAQSLRSWAGAHAGPMSSRYGLKYLLDAATQTKSTVFLLDLLTPDTLSALDYLNALPQIRKLADQGILALPDVGYIAKPIVPGDIFNIVFVHDAYNLDLNEVWNIGNNMGGLYVYHNIEFFISFSVNDYAHVDKYYSMCSLSPNYININGQSSILSLQCKRLFLSMALAQPTIPLVLGGDFSNSILGDPIVSLEVLRYIKSHPWIQILSINDLATSIGLQSASPPPYYENQLYLGENTQHPYSITRLNPSLVETKVYESLLQSPKNKITDLAWQVFFSLVQPASPDLSSLR